MQVSFPGRAAEDWVESLGAKTPLNIDMALMMIRTGRVEV